MTQDRRTFLKQSSQIALVTSGIIATKEMLPVVISQTDNLNIVGPKEGFTPQVGTLVSMMDWMRNTVLSSLRGLSSKDIDYIHDEDANSIGAMLLHLGATERFYQLNTFENRSWGNWPQKDRDEWSAASSLGHNARRQIKDNDLSYYVEKIEAVRANTLSELAKRDDEWLLSVDNDWGWGPTNNYCKWFHVCEHESNHNGQIKWLKSRIS